MAKYPTNGRPRPRPDTPRPRPFKPHRPVLPGWPNRPIPKVPPIPKGAVSIVSRLGKIGMKAVPYVGAALTLYEIYDLYSQMTVQPHKGYKLNCTYSACWLNGTATPNSYILSNGYPNGACIQHCAQISDIPALPVPNGTNSKHVILAVQHSNGLHYTTRETWERIVPVANANFAQPSITPLPETFPQTRPEYNPFYRPATAPALQPKTPPRPMRRPNPGEQPANWPKKEPGPKPKNEPKFRPKPLRVPTMPFPVTVYPKPSPETPVYPKPPEQVLIVPKPPGRGGNMPKPRYRENPNRARERRPRKKERERKVNVRTVAGVGWGIINTFTEGLDFLDVLYEATNEKCQQAAKKKAYASGYPSYVPPHLKAQAVYNCWDTIDVGSAIEGYINNQIEDFVYGQIGMQLGKASGKFGTTTGLNRAMKEHFDRTEGDLSDFIPQVDWDPETGVATVTLPALGSISTGG